jgi:hypothetical protein
VDSGIDMPDAASPDVIGVLLCPETYPIRQTTVSAGLRLAFCCKCSNMAGVMSALVAIGRASDSDAFDTDPNGRGRAAPHGHVSEK